jgi:gas vesicle protein
MNTTSKIVAATAVGVGIGALLGVLFAPDKGSATRDKIKDKSKKLAHTGKEKINEFKEEIVEMVNGKKEPEATPFS